MGLIVHSMISPTRKHANSPRTAVAKNDIYDLQIEWLDFIERKQG
jgi:hypothetical protein